MPEAILELKDVGCSQAPGQPIFSKVNLTVNEGDVVILQGKSGCGKTTLLKCLAHLNLYEGEITYRGKSPQSYGIPTFRTRVLYVPQRPSLLPGTPRDFLETISNFGSRNPKGMFGKSKDKTHAPSDFERPLEIAYGWGIDEELWDRNWGNLSGGESQRIALAVAVGLGNAEILLLDEPTSALDAATSENVEKQLLEEVRRHGGTLKALVWITHSAEQGKRVGTRFMRVTAGGLHEEEPQRDV